MQVNLLRKLKPSSDVPFPLTNPSPFQTLPDAFVSFRIGVYIWSLAFLSIYRWLYLGWSRSIYHVFRHNSRMGHWPWLICLWREGPLIFASLLDESRCGHFAVMWSFSSWSSEVWSTESSFFAIISATLLFCAKLAVTNLLLAVDTKSGTSVYISFPFIVLTDRFLNWVYQNIRTVVRNHPSESVSLPSMDVTQQCFL